MDEQQGRFDLLRDDDLDIASGGMMNARTVKSLPVAASDGVGWDDSYEYHIWTTWATSLPVA